MRRALPILIVFLLASGPLTLRAQEAGAEETSSEEARPAPAGPDLTRDALGRSFPDPVLLARSRAFVGFGITMTVGSAVMTLVGLNLGSAIARGQILIGENARIGLGVFFAGGSMLGFVGVPMLSAGTHMNKQLKRTIKGTEKLPRTVANEARYWRAYVRSQYGRSLSLSGGASLLMATLATVAVAGIMNTDRYDPRLWIGVVGSYAAGAAMIPGGLALRKAALRDMEAVRDEVDPLRQPGGKLSRRVVPRPGLPSPLLTTVGDGRGGRVLHVGLSWGLSY